MKAVLGLDTSCYTTSCALADTEGHVIDQRRRLLSVDAGERGLMQSEMVFQHVNRLPVLVEELMAAHPEAEIAAVCASTRPRPVADSYMPVFTVSEGFGRSIAAVHHVPFVASTHQEGHIRAAMVDTGLKPGCNMLALHLSGGTTELLHVKDGTLTLVGGSNDLHAGQFVDRVGVALGLGFPCGPALEELAVKGSAKALLPTWVHDCDCSFSGSESAAQRMIEKGELTKEDMAAEVYSCIERTLCKLILNAAEKTDTYRILIAGGVASSKLLRSLLTERMKKRNRNMKVFFGRPELSGDNACGVALLGSEQLAVGSEQ